MVNLSHNLLNQLSSMPRFHANRECSSYHFIYDFSNYTITRNSYRRKRILTISSRVDNSGENKQQEQQQQLNLSVLRFTFGIPGLDESYLPRWLGYTFGSLLLLNHFIASTSPITSAQLISEALGLSLAAFSVAVPYLGRFLKGVGPLAQSTLPEGNKQIFVMSENLSATQKEDLAWGTYVLLRNTNTISVLISVRGALCIRGYWSTPEDASKSGILDWFEKQIQIIGLADLKSPLYFPQNADSGAWEILPRGTRSLLVQPLLEAPNFSANKGDAETSGFIVLASSTDYAYSDRDKAWIGAITNKFK